MMVSIIQKGTTALLCYDVCIYDGLLLHTGGKHSLALCRMARSLRGGETAARSWARDIPNKVDHRVTMMSRKSVLVNHRVYVDTSVCQTYS